MNRTCHPYEHISTLGEGNRMTMSATANTITYNDAIQLMKPLESALRLTIDWVPVISVGLVSLLFLLATIWFFRRRRSHTLPDTVHIQHPRIVATNELTELWSRHEEEHIHDFYDALALSVKRYFQAMFHVQLLSLPTSEAINSLSKRLSVAESERVMEFLITCDNAKFSPITYDVPLHRRHWEIGLTLINDIGMDTHAF